MNTDHVLEVAPHYVAMLVIVYVVLTSVQILVGRIGFWTELVIIAVVVFAYRPVVMRLGVGPSVWEQR